MVNLDKVAGRYRFALNLYFDEINQDVGGVPDAEALFSVYRKSDNKRVTSFYASYTNRRAINYINQTCATQRQIKTSLYRYEHVVNWNPADYNDVEGTTLLGKIVAATAILITFANQQKQDKHFTLNFQRFTRIINLFLTLLPFLIKLMGSTSASMNLFVFLLKQTMQMEMSYGTQWLLPMIGWILIWVLEVRTA